MFVCPDPSGQFVYVRGKSKREGMTAEVIVDIAHSEVDKIFEYRSIEGVREGSRVKVLVVCTNEELMIARDTKALAEAR